MSNEIVVQNDSDLTEADIVKVKEFSDSGMPGLARIDDAILYRMTEMYLAGSTYYQISHSMNLSKALVMYVSHTYGWYPSKKEYLSEIDHKIKGRLGDSNLLNQDFLLLLAQGLQKKITKKLERYLATDDPSHANEINLKEVDKLLKTIDMIKELNNEGKSSKGKTPAVGLNLDNFSGTIERSGENQVTITPKERVLGDVLARHADKLRAEANSKAAQTSDIKKNVTKNEE